MKRNFWDNHIDRLWNSNSAHNHQVRGQTFWMFHLKANNLQADQTMTLNIRASVSILSMHFVVPFCSLRYIVIPMSKNTRETDASHFSDFSSFLPLRVRKDSTLSWDIFNIQFTLGNLIPRSKSSLLDRGLAEFIFPNTTFFVNDEKLCFCCNLSLSYNLSLGDIELCEVTNKHSNKYEAPLLITGENFREILLTTDKDEYTFLSCGDIYNDPPNFLALFMPFSKTTWVLIFVTIFGWPLVLSLIENDFNLKHVLKDFDALLIGWAMILEQSHLRATNYKGRGPLYGYCGCVLLAILVLSNAYKGDNIQAGYKKYIRKVCTNVLSGLLGRETCTGDFYSLANRSRNQFTDKQYKLWKPNDIQVTYTNPYSKTKYDNQAKLLNSFGQCRKKALLGWRSALANSE